MHHRSTPWKRRSLLILLASAAAGLAAPVGAWEIKVSGREAMVTGSGRLVDEARPIGDLARLRIDGPFTVLARRGDIPALSVRADDNLLPLIVTERDGDALRIGPAAGASMRTRSDVVITVTLPRLAAAELRGSGDLSLTGFGGDRLALALSGSGDVKADQARFGTITARLAGSGDITLEGQGDELDVSIAGSGDVHAAGFRARRVSVAIAGSGDARVHAQDELRSRIAGSGDVLYHGRPTLHTRIAGSGSVRAAP